MSKHEKHARAAARQEHDVQAGQIHDEALDALEGSEEILKTSFTAGNEMKIAVAVILVLLVVFAAAVVKWMRHSSGSASNSSEETVANRDNAPGDDGDTAKPKRPENSSPFGSSSTSAKVAAVPGPGPDYKSKTRAGEPDTWTLASDSRLKPARAQDDRLSPPSPSLAGRPFQAVPNGLERPSYGPGVAPGDSGSRIGAPSDRSAPKTSFGHWEHDTAARTPAAGQQPSDPFRSRPAVDGLRRDTPGTAAAAPTAPNAFASDTSKGPPRPEVGRIGNPSYGAANPSDVGRTANPSGVGRIGNPSYGAADPSRTMPRSPDLSLPSSASRAPAAAGDSNPLRTSGIAGPIAGSSSAVSPRRLSDTAPSSFAPPNSTSIGGRADATYVVQFADDFWSISQKLFGTGGYSRALAKHNEKKYPRESDLKAGDMLLTPSAAKLEQLYPELCPAPARRNSVESQPRTASVPTRPDGPRTYVVQDGDTLYDIARRELGKAARWREIYDMNKDLITQRWLDLEPGTRILLPDADAGSVSRRQGVGSLR